MNILDPNTITSLINMGNMYRKRWIGGTKFSWMRFIKQWTGFSLRKHDDNRRLNTDKVLKEKEEGTNW